MTEEQEEPRELEAPRGDITGKELEPVHEGLDRLVLQQLASERDPVKIESGIEILKSLYPELAAQHGKPESFEFTPLKEEEFRSLRTPFPEDLEQQIETRFHQAIDHVQDDTVAVPDPEWDTYEHIAELFQ